MFILSRFVLYLSVDFMRFHFHFDLISLIHLITHCTIFCSVGLPIYFWGQFGLVHIWFHQLLMNRNLHLLFCYFQFVSHLLRLYFESACTTRFCESTASAKAVKRVVIFRERPKANRLFPNASDLVSISNFQWSEVARWRNIFDNYSNLIWACWYKIPIKWSL